LLQVAILREYLEYELEEPNLPFQYDMERGIDDWVCLCFFVGNDFLPHLPSLEIRENAIDRLIRIYKRNLATEGGYLTEKGNLNYRFVQSIMSDLGLEEDAIFLKRKEGTE
jgi:5'-3' exoribonuclease 2